MTPKRPLAQIALLVLLLLLAPALAQAAVVGQFTQVEGQVGLLKQGKLPALAVKVGDGVEPGDVVRTKSHSRAQIRFVDESVVTLAPESRVAVADYFYDQAGGSRRAVLRVFRGLVQTVVTLLLEAQEPNFIVETHTAVLGVRGTEWYTLLMPNFTSIYLVSGLLDVKSINPQLPAVLPLKGLEFTQVPRGMQPHMPQRLTPAMLDMLKKMMATGIGDHVLLGGGPQLGVGAQGLGEFKLPVSPEQMTQPIIPPTIVPPAPPPPPGPSGPSGF
jgi:hypothetical protein